MELRATVNLKSTCPARTAYRNSGLDFGVLAVKVVVGVIVRNELIFRIIDTAGDRTFLDGFLEQSMLTLQSSMLAEQFGDRFWIAD